MKFDLYDFCASLFKILYYCYYLYTNNYFSLRQIYDISHTREEEFRRYWPKCFESEEEKEEDNWRRTRLLIFGFNEARSNIAASYLRLGGDSMSAIPFHTTSKEDLPHFFNIFRNPEPFGTDFNTVD